MIENFLQHNKPVAFACHAPRALIKVKVKNSDALVKGGNITGFSNTEEEAVKLTDVVPFSLENEIKKLGGIIVKDLIGAAMY